MRRENFPGSRENIHNIVNSCFTAEGELATTAKDLTAEKREALRGWLSSFSSSNAIEYENLVMREKVQTILGIGGENQKTILGPKPIKNKDQFPREDKGETYTQYTERLARDAYQRQLHNARTWALSANLKPQQIEALLGKSRDSQMRGLTKNFVEYIQELRLLKEKGSQSPIRHANVNNIIDFIFNRNFGKGDFPVRKWGRPADATSYAEPFKLEDQWACAEDAITQTNFTLEEAEACEAEWIRIIQEERKSEDKFDTQDQET